VVVPLDAELLAGVPLHRDVGLPRGIVGHRHRREAGRHAGVGERSHAVADGGADAVHDLVAVDYRGRGRSQSGAAAGRLPPTAVTSWGYATAGGIGRRRK
jgi:hypothetical protein